MALTITSTAHVNYTQDMENDLLVRINGTLPDLSIMGVTVAQGGEGANAAQRRGGAAPSGATWVRVDKEYRFETGSLADLFRGRSQILVYHYTAGCPSCSAIVDGFNGFVVHLTNHDVMLWAVSRAPLAKL